MAESQRFYVYWLDHGNDRWTASLVPRWSGFFLPAPPSVHGFGKSSLLKSLAQQYLWHLDQHDDSADRYLWTETLEPRSARVEIHPSTHIGTVEVLGRRTVPLRLCYGVVTSSDQGCLVVVPRFDASVMVEAPSMADQMVRQQLPAWLAGLPSNSLFDVRSPGEGSGEHQSRGAESLEAWKPPSALLRRPGEEDFDDDGEALLHSVAEDGSAKARRKRQEPVIDVFDVDAHRRLMDRYPPASLLLVGPPGVGKSSWVRALAENLLKWQRDAERGDPPHLWLTSADRLMAGMSYLGEWEQRCLNVADQLAYSGDYLYVGRLMPMVKSRGHSSIADLWREDLEEGRISLIAECTTDELEICGRVNPGFLRPFRQIRLDPPSVRQMPGLVRRYVARGAEGLELTDSAVSQLVLLTDSYQRHEVFPGKAFRFVDVLARERAGGTPSDGAPRPLTADHITRSFCRWSGLPEELVSDDKPVTLEHVTDRLAAGVVGQRSACAAMARVLARFKAGIHDPQKPLGTLLFVGPTGVGKTEAAKQLATYMFGSSERMLRYDMSEFQSPGSARRLLAVGRGVNSLAQSLRRTPLSLVLLDEIEKAHPEVFDLLLGALGEGRLTDADGQTVDFRMSVLVMTSNLGSGGGPDLGFGPSTPSAGKHLKAVTRHFRPEWVNRLDEVVSFRSLAPEDMERIVDLMVAKTRLRPGLKGRNLRLHLEPAARSWLARRGFHATRGARPLQRLIEEKIVTPLAVRISERPDYGDLDVFVVAGSQLSLPDGADSIVLA